MYYTLPNVASYSYSYSYIARDRRAVSYSEPGTCNEIRIYMLSCFQAYALQLARATDATAAA